MSESAKKVMTPEFRVSFPKILTPGQEDDNGKRWYEMTCLFGDGADLTALKKLAKAAADEKWGDNKPSNMRSPFRDQGEKAYEGYEPGNTFIKVKAKVRPGLVDAALNDIIDESEFYGGCYARCTVTALAYGGPGTKFSPGVSFWVENIQKLRDGDSFSNRSKPQDDFEAVDTPAGESGDGDGDDIW